MPDPRGVAKRINTHRPAAPGGLTAVPRVLRRRPGRWPGSWRAPEGLLCRGGDTGGHQTATPRSSRGLVGAWKSHRHLPHAWGVWPRRQEDVLHRSHALEDVTTCPMLLAVSPRDLHSLGRAAIHVLQLEGDTRVCHHEPSGTDSSTEPGLGSGDTGLGWGCGSALLGDTSWCKGHSRPLP